MVAELRDQRHAAFIVLEVASLKEGHIPLLHLGIGNRDLAGAIDEGRRILITEAG